MPRETTEKRFVTIVEAAKVLEVPEQLIVDLVENGVIEHEVRGDDEIIFVEVYGLNDYINEREQIQQRRRRARKPNRVKNAKRTVDETNELVIQIGRMFGDIIDSIAELGSLVPMLEIVVTVAAYWGAGLSAVYGVEVLAGFAMAQIVALFLSAHYRDVAMHWVGDTAIFLAIVGGAINTGIAIYLALATARGFAIHAALIFIPAFSSAFAVLFMYFAKMFTHDRQQKRLQLRHAAEEELKEFKRRQKADRQRRASLDNMELTMLGMQERAMTALAENPGMIGIQMRAMVMRMVKDMMGAFEINPRSVLGREMVELGNQVLEGLADEFEAELNPMDADEFDADTGVEDLSDFLPHPSPVPTSNGHS